eukprot:Seg1307.12 transcript_id=Seg1307.12/GoldUCD/mRNA.D3Y31 product="hypothetical protein" protein_id=Seg1307.12/GoldUCD/D3Y31
MGLKACQNCFRGISISSETEGTSDPMDNWFLKPHKVKGKDTEAVIQGMWTDEDNLNNTAGIDENLQTSNGPSREVENFQSINGIIEETSALGSELRCITDTVEKDLFEDTEDLATNIEVAKAKTKLTVHVPQVGEVHKSTVVSLLNTSLNNISTDRLRRVRLGCQQQVSEST